MKRISLVLAALLLALTALPALAQGSVPELEIRLSRDFGYGGFDNKIQGRFTIHVRDADGFERVDFYIDDELIGSRSEDPFTLQFNTDKFDSGQHLIYAIGYSGEEQARSDEIQRFFIAGDEVGQQVIGAIIPILAVLAVAAGLSAFLPRLIWGRKGYTVGDYGAAGGAICKQCAKPFGRHVMAPNMVMGKLERCPHCGKWQIARRASPPELEAAEAFLVAEGSSGVQNPKQESEEERLKRQIDESRYE